MSSKGVLRNISPDQIERNPDNPRLFFRPEELNTLQSSIAQFGIRVPLSVYEVRKGHYVLIDGERRWLSAKKLNLGSVPALIHDKPSPLDNLLLMYNIHALREQWDYFTIASRIPRIQSLYAEQHGFEPSERDLIRITGLSQGQLRRCKNILGLPEKYKTILLEELKLPKHRQRLGEDFFIEMESALRSVARHFPYTIEDKNRVRDTLVAKYRNETIKSVTEFRKLAKMASAPGTLDIDPETVEVAIVRVFDAKDEIGIDAAFQETIEDKAQQRRAELQIDALLEFLRQRVARRSRLSGSIRLALAALQQLISQVLGDK